MIGKSYRRFMNLSNHALIDYFNLYNDLFNPYIFLLCLVGFMHPGQRYMLTFLNNSPYKIAFFTLSYCSGQFKFANIDNKT